MDELRKPFFVLAIVLMGLVLIVEIGALLGIGASVPAAGRLNEVVGHMGEGLGQAIEIDAREVVSRAEGQDKPPGLGIPSLALMDALLFFTVALMGLSLMIPGGVHGRIQGVATFVFSLIMVILAAVLIGLAVQLLMVMIGLFVAVPFGLIAYLAIWGFFDQGGAAVLLFFILMLKAGFAVCLVLAHQRFIQNNGLVLIILTSLLATTVVSFLHGFVPVFLVSITDAIGAIIVAILALVWALFFLAGSVKSVTRILRVDKAAS